MRRFVRACAVLIGVALLAACTSGGLGVRLDTSGAPAPTDSDSTYLGGGRVAFEVVAVLSQTGAGMSRGAGTSGRAVAVGDRAGLERLLDGIGAELAAKVRAAVAGARVPAGDALVGQAIGYGCHGNSVTGVFQLADGW